jgi:hypothetical protein
MDVPRITIPNFSAAMISLLLVLTAVVDAAQSRLTKEELAAIESAASTNQSKLSHYTWQEIQFILINDKAVDYRLYSAKIGADGKYHRNLVTEHTGHTATFEPNTKEQLSQYGPYAQRLYELANQYTSLNSGRLSQGDSGGEIAVLRDKGLIKLTIMNYSTPGDSLVMNIDQHTHHLVSVQAKSHLTEPQDAVTIKAEFAELPDGTNHVANAEIDSVGRHLTVKLTNWSYQ